MTGVARALTSRNEDEERWNSTSVRGLAPRTARGLSHSCETTTATGRTSSPATRAGAAPTVATNSGVSGLRALLGGVLLRAVLTAAAVPALDGDPVGVLDTAAVATAVAAVVVAFLAALAGWAAGQAERGALRRRAELNAFSITFADRFPAAETY
jgi:hypothetical protein